MPHLTERELHLLRLALLCFTNALDELYPYLRVAEPGEVRALLEKLKEERR